MKINKDKARSVMKEKKITYDRLGEMLGCTKQNAWYYLHRENPKYETIEKVANALGIDISELIEW